jgi:hypothetical protein
VTTDVTVVGEGGDLEIFNVLDVPAGVLPVTTVTADDVSAMADYPDLNEAFTDIKKAGFHLEYCRIVFLFKANADSLAQHNQNTICSGDLLLTAVATRGEEARFINIVHLRNQP